MREISLFTKTKIEGKTINDGVIETYEFSKKITENSEHCLFLGKYPREFYIDFDYSIDIDDELAFPYLEIKDLIPFRPAKVNTLFFHDYRVVRSVISSIADKYPELYVFDHEKDVVLPALDYVNSQN